MNPVSGLIRHSIGSGRLSILARRQILLSGIRFQSTSDIKTYIPKPTVKVKRPKTKEELAREKHEKALQSPYRLVRWAAVAGSEKFQKGMTKYMIGIYAVFLIYGVYFSKKLFQKEKELEKLEEKAKTSGINEYESLKIKEYRGKLRRRDELKLEQYEKLKEEGVTNFDEIVLENNDQNRLNESIIPAHDTTEFYDHKAEEYDKAINKEERAILMGRKRKWQMKHCEGDVLEVACGTGRNIKYMNPDKINSITFLDSSENMLEIANKKFRDRFPTYKKVAFVKGKAEDLVDLVGKDEKQKKSTQYDTIIESFGLCSHEDPVKALKNFQELLKPGGRIVLLEHGRGSWSLINKILDKRAKRRIETWGCRWNLDIGEILDDSGLDVVEEHKSHLGTTWCVVAKKKSDVRKKKEIGFIEKYFSSGIREKIKQMNEENLKSQTDSNQIDQKNEVKKTSNDS
ncbi:Methyltransferase OMS1, mitochondrial [Nakaseomyces bracarensis]|uniref:Methyltransferase OMS1, mitochondrial n=1 Tax=Nakaseomyces bracarensis TaxID=273131 RepID=A0ABR4NYF6_9SACH